MKLDSSQFPTKIIKELHLYKDEKNTLKNEFIVYDPNNLLQLN